MRLMPRHRRNQTKPLRWTPGIFLGGLVIAIAWTIAPDGPHWSVYAVALVIMIIVDSFLKIQPVRTPKVKKETTYVQD